MMTLFIKSEMLGIVMVSIPHDAQLLMDQEKVVVVGSADKLSICNVSPRSSMTWSNSYIYWLEFFKHKSYQNFKDNPWVSIVVFDSAKQHGYQMKGKVKFCQGDEKREILYKITQSIPKAIERIYEEKLKNEDLEVIRFDPHAIYSLDPRQETGRLLALDKDDETLSKFAE